MAKEIIGEITSVRKTKAGVFVALKVESGADIPVGLVNMTITASQTGMFEK